MAPLRSEPSSLKAVLGPARREALRQLIGEITAAHMRPRLELGIDDDDNGRAKGTACLVPPASEASEATEAALEAPTRMTEIPMPTPEPGPPRHGHGTADAELVALRASALAHFDKWKENVVANLKRMLEEDEEESRKRREERRAVPEAERDAVPPSPGVEENHPLRPERDPTMTTSSDETRDYWERTVEAQHAIYPPVPTILATLPAQERTEVLRAMLFFLLSMGGGGYSSYSRTLLVLLTSALALPLAVLNQAEKEIMATTMLKMSSSSSSQTGEMCREEEGLGHHQQSTKEEVQQQEDNRASSSRLWKVGLASAAGAAALGVTGGLAGPVVAGAVGGLMGSVGLGGLASVLGVFWTKGALVGTLFGAVGAGMTVRCFLSSSGYTLLPPFLAVFFFYFLFFFTLTSHPGQRDG